MKKLLGGIKKHIVTFVKSVVIGATLRVPGMSGGTTAIILGIYDRLLSAVNNFFKNIKENLVFLLVFALGGGLAFVAFNSLVYKVTSRFPAISAYFFVGIILFGIPALIKEAGISYHRGGLSSLPIQPKNETEYSNKNISLGRDRFGAKNKGNNNGNLSDAAFCNDTDDKALKIQSVQKSTKKRALASQIMLDLIPFLCGAVAVVGICLLQNQGLLDDSGYDGFGGYVFNIFMGIFAGAALVLPGLSFTYFMTVIGLMDVLSKSISLSTLNLGFLTSFGVGAIIGLIATAKILGSLIERHKRGTYLCVIGFLIGSVVMLLTDPEYIPAKNQIFLCALFFVLGSALILGATFLAARFSAKRMTERESVEKIAGQSEGDGRKI